MSDFVLLNFACSFRFQWPWLHFRVTAVYNIVNFVTCIYEQGRGQTFFDESCVLDHNWRRLATHDASVSSNTTLRSRTWTSHYSSANQRSVTSDVDRQTWSTWSQSCVSSQVIQSLIFTCVLFFMRKGLTKDAKWLTIGSCKKRMVAIQRIGARLHEAGHMQLLLSKLRT